MKTFEQFIREEKADVIQRLGEDFLLNKNWCTGKELLQLVDRWQKLQQCNVMRSLPPVGSEVYVKAWVQDNSCGVLTLLVANKGNGRCKTIVELDDVKVAMPS